MIGVIWMSLIPGSADTAIENATPASWSGIATMAIRSSFPMLMNLQLTE
jgi:hypothetical protein